ncbi:DUF4167 domain-containing protein [Sphingomonas sp. AAP5]|uniref:DUF4167 domain-containing protein n=1 Tax=Sphingomonas sp. AAP5 TaxID=1523415 RepID=UPI001057284C|nr:DUF4167 domain-containing protein [Sphingomonas sp. AAP5]QBM77303.1 DUF4167 domain-containing protein [Sphingomonas sp. AAP5]
MINNRQAGRRRGRGGQQQRSSGGGGNPGRQDTGNRIDNRARGNAAQLLEKYKTLARDAQMQGDRVNVEYYLQFADHYFRVLAETRARFEENGGAVSTKRIQGATLDEDEPDYEDEGERVVEQPRQEQARQDQPRQEQQRHDPSRQEQPRGDQQRGGQNGYRQDGNRQDGNRQDGNRGYAQNGQSNHAAANGQSNGQHGSEQREAAQGYEDRPRGRVNGNGEGGYDRQAEPQREERAERQPRGERYERPDRVSRALEPVVEAQPTGAELPLDAAALVEPVAEAPRRGRGRPRREVAPIVEAPVTSDAAGSDDGGFEDNGFAADRLPPSLNVSAVVEPEFGQEGDVVEKPRRRRGRPPATAATTVE